MRVGAILFDFDGVLIESEWVGNRQIADWLTGHGHPTTTAQALALFSGWSGAAFRERVAARIGGPIPRCAVIDHHPETGVKDVRLLKALVAWRPTNRAGEPMFGVYARCVTPGRVTVGC